MKKLILAFLLIFSFTSYGQAEFEKIALTQNTASTTATKVNVQETNGEINYVTGNNIPIPYTPINYNVLTPTTGGHFGGIDTKLGTLSSTTAGITTRVWFTADVSVVSATNYYATNPTSKGTLASAIQNVVNNDDEKKYFAQDVIGAPFATATMFPPGVYAGNLSASTSPNSALQRWTVELYKCNNAGTPIASGVTGAPVGSLGVTVVTILDSGLLNLVDGSVTNVQVSGNLGGTGLSVAVGERIRYHVSAEKVGTAGANITQSVYYGTSYNSFLDVPVPLNTTEVQNLSAVSGATTTDALNALNAAIPANYSKIVYVNNNNPNSATIFDLNNPPVTNDNSLKTDVNNLYIGLDASGWVYNSTSLNYVTKTVTSITSNFYLEGTTTDAGNSKTANIYRMGRTGFGSSTITGVLDIFTGTASYSADLNALPNGNLSFGNDDPLGNAPTIFAKSTNSIGLSLISGTPETNLTDDMRFNVRSLTNTDFSDLTRSAFRFVRGGNNTLLQIFRNGNAALLGNYTIGGKFVWGSGAYSAGISQIYNDATNGTVFIPKSGATYDFQLTNGAAQGVMSIYQGTQNVLFNGSVTSSSLTGTQTEIVTTDLNGKLGKGGVVTSGTYTPTLTGTGNVSTVTVQGVPTYSRIGNIVTVNISVVVAPTLGASTLTTFTATLPINRGVATPYNVGTGTLYNGSTAIVPAYVQTVATNTVTCVFFPLSVASVSGSITFQYSL